MKVLSQMTREELRAVAKQHGVAGWRHDNVPQLRERLLRAVPTLAGEGVPPQVTAVTKAVTLGIPIFDPTAEGVPSSKYPKDVWSHNETDGWIRTDGVRLRAVHPSRGYRWLAVHPEDKRELRMVAMYLDFAQSRVNDIWPLNGSGNHLASPGSNGSEVLLHASAQQVSG